MSCAAVLSVLAFWCLPPMLARCNLFMFLQSVAYINIKDTLDFWFTADEQCVAGEEEEGREGEEGKLLVVVAIAAGGGDGKDRKMMRRSLW